MDRDQQAIDFIAAMGSAIHEEFAQGGGARVNALASILDCPAAVRPYLAAKLQGHFDVLVPAFDAPAPAILAALKSEISHDARLAQTCGASDRA